MENKIEKSPELARVIADLTGDGHLQYDGKRGVIYFYSKNLNVIKSFNKRFSTLFNINGKIRKVKYTGKAFTLRFVVYFCAKHIARILYDMGTPAGNKTNNGFSIPEWILNGNKKIKRKYLQGIYSSEGSVYPTKIENGFRWRIEMEQWKNLRIKNEGIKYLSQIKKLLSVFGIESSPPRFGKKQIRKDGSKSIATRIDIEKKYFKRFYDEIGFDDKLKNKRLLNAIAG